MATRFLLTDKCPTLSCSAGCRVCNSQKGEDTANQDNSLAGAFSCTVTEWVARLDRLLSVIGDSGHNKISAVNCNHRRLCKARPRIELLHKRVYTHDGNCDTKYEVECNKKPI